MFYDIYSRLCSQKGVSPSRAAVDMGFYRSSVSYWKNKGGSPGKDGLKKMSEYFGVSTDVLTGKTEMYKDNKANKDISVKKPKVKKSSGTAKIEDKSKNEKNKNKAPSSEPHSQIEKQEKQSRAVFATELARAYEYINKDSYEAPSKLKDRIKQLRKQQDLSVGYIAGAVGVDRRTYLMWESGEIESIRKYKLGKLAKVLGTTVDYLLGKDSVPNGVQEINNIDLKPFVNLIKTRGECLAMLLLSRDMSRRDIELTIEFMRSLKAAENRGL